MEVHWLEALILKWWIPAACDLVALSAVVGMAALLLRPAPALAARTETAPAPVEVRQKSVASVQTSETNELPIARTDVKRALAAIGRWEDSYRSGRGVVELARFVQKQDRREVAGR
jgi:hypothetical protein